MAKGSGFGLDQDAIHKNRIVRGYVHYYLQHGFHVSFAEGASFSTNSYVKLIFLYHMLATLSETLLILTNKACLVTLTIGTYNSNFLDIFPLYLRLDGYSFHSHISCVWM